MNNDRRKVLKNALNMLENAKVDIEYARDEESEYYDNMPESFQYGEKGERAQEVVGYLDEALSALDETLNAVESAVD